jgi:hypothetical protein
MRIHDLVGLALSMTLLTGCGSQEGAAHSGSSLVLPAGETTRPLTEMRCSGTKGVVVTPCPAKIGESGVEITVSGPGVVDSGIGCVDEPFGCEKVNNLQWRLVTKPHTDCWKRLNKVIGRNAGKREVGYFRSTGRQKPLLAST